MDPVLIVGFAAMAITLLMMIGTALSCYKRCGPNQAMIISGLGAQAADSDFKIVKYGGALVLPIVQECRFLSMEVMPIELLTTAPIVTENDASVSASAKAQVKVRDDYQSIAKAAELFLSASEEEIKAIAHEILITHLRTAIEKREWNDGLADFESVALETQIKSDERLKTMGLTVVSFIIMEIKPYAVTEPGLNAR